MLTGIPPGPAVVLFLRPDTISDTSSKVTGATNIDLRLGSTLHVKVDSYNFLTKLAGVSIKNVFSRLATSFGSPGIAKLFCFF